MECRRVNLLPTATHCEYATWYFQKMGKPIASTSLTATTLFVTHAVALQLSCEFGLRHKMLVLLTLPEMLASYKSRTNIHHIRKPCAPFIVKIVTIFDRQLNIKQYVALQYAVMSFTMQIYTSSKFTHNYQRTVCATTCHFLSLHLISCNIVR